MIYYYLRLYEEEGEHSPGVRADQEEQHTRADLHQETQSDHTEVADSLDTARQQDHSYLQHGTIEYSSRVP